ncbi:MAG TPA: ABC transporter permease [Gemmatimonadaceae bacterium]
MRGFSSKLPRHVRRLFRLPLTRARILRDEDDEMQFHLAMRVAELRAGGMSEHEAEAEALRRFGDTADYRAYSSRRATRKARWMSATETLDALAQDVRFTLRQWRKSRAFTATALVTLALGIGANTAIFSVAHRLLLAPLPYPNGNRIVMPMVQDARGILGSVDSALVEEWHASSRTIEEIAGAEEGPELVSLQSDGTVDSIPYAGMTANFLRVLGVQPVLGRSFTAEEERTGAAVALISDALWQSRYNGRVDVLGGVIGFQGKQYQIVGVTPPGLTIPMSSDWARTRPDVSYPMPSIWLPETLKNSTNSGGGAPAAFAKLRAGVSADVATSELAALALHMADAATREGRVRAMRAQDFMDVRETRAVRILFAAVGALLLIACANVANLLLARAWSRRREFAVRLALGAGRARVVRQALTESIMLAVLGGALGVAVAWLTLKIIIALRPVSLDHLADVHLDTPVLLWCAVLSVIAGIVFGSAPSFLVGGAVGDVLKNETRTGSGGLGARRARSTLTVLEIAMSLTLLVCAGLLLRSFLELQRMPLGFEPRGLVFVDALVGAGRSYRERRLLLRNEVIDRLRALPGVRDAAIGMIPGKGFLGDGIEADAGGSGPPIAVKAIGVNFISPNYFRVAGVHLVEGRVPDSLAVTPAWKTGPPILSSEVVVNRELARRIWPRRSPIGERIREERPVRPGASEPAWSTVVGIADDIHLPGLHDDLRQMQVYSLITPHFPEVPFLVRTAGSGEDAAASIQRTIVSVDPGIFARPAISGEAYLRDSMAPTRFAMALLIGFAVVALVLSTVGLYGLVAYGVTQRTHEIGIRMALGAEPRRVAEQVLGDGLRYAGLGLLLGAVMMWGASRFVTSMLYAVTPVDPLTIAAALFLVLGSSLLASFIPALRAVQVDPTNALRAD